MLTNFRHLLSAALLAVFLTSLAQAAQQPNVVLIMIDDFGYECVSAYGGTSYQTPHMDALAAGGVRAERCHAQPLCTPTRVQLMTGQYNIRNYTHFGHLDPGQTTFAQLFKQAGYTTCITGKWQLGRDFKLPAHFGFDKYCLWQLMRRPPRYANAKLEIDGEMVDIPQGEYGPDVVNQYARDFIKSNKDRPFLLYYPMILTHGPFQPTPDSKDWDPATKNEKTQIDRSHFADMVSYADKLIGKVVSTLEETGLRENTLLIVVGDNGSPHGIPSQMGDRTVIGGKNSFTDAGTHVPLMVNWPGTIPAGQVLDDLIDTTDFMPTICQAAGVSIPQDLTQDGRSFLPQLLGKEGHPRDWIYVWFSRGGGPTADAEFAMDKHYKLYDDGRLFDLTKDINEQKPLEGELPCDATKAKHRLSHVLDKYEDARPAEFAGQAQPFGVPKD